MTSLLRADMKSRYCWLPGQNEVVPGVVKMLVSCLSSKEDNLFRSSLKKFFLYIYSVVMKQKLLYHKLKSLM